MAEVAEQDGERLERICAGEADAFFELVKPGADELRWCGFSPLYTFLASLRSSPRSEAGYFTTNSGISIHSRW